MEDLNDFYGPASEEDSLQLHPAFSFESMTKLTYQESNYEDLETTWFEMEDETNHLFL